MWATIEVLCDKPITGDYPNQRGVANVNENKIKGNDWPTCEQLPCVCLGDSKLIVNNVDRSKEVLRFECNTTTNFDSFIDVTGSTYIIPKVENCGTYKPDSPNPRARCDCPEIPARKMNNDLDGPELMKLHMFLFQMKTVFIIHSIILFSNNYLE